MPRIIFHPDIRAEIQTAYDWYNENSSGLGEEFLLELDRAIEAIITKPLMWSSYSYGFRRYLLNRFPFAIIYKPEKDFIYVVAVMHLSKRPGYWRRRI